MNLLTPIVLVVALGILAAILLTIASKVFAVPVDKKVTELRVELPGANCGACGYAGCDDYAAAMANDPSVGPGKCTVGGADVAAKLAEILGTDAKGAERQVAKVMCNGTTEAKKQILDWQGLMSCKAAKTFYDGSSACRYGCIGFGDCEKVCDFNAIKVIDGVALVNYNNCVACGKCIDECPQNIIKLIPAKSQVTVLCSSNDKAAATMKACKNGCIGCGKCEKTCKFDAIHVVDGLAKIDTDKCTNCGQCVYVCPTGAINSIRHLKPKPPKKTPAEIAALKAKAEAAKVAKEKTLAE